MSSFSCQFTQEGRLCFGDLYLEPDGLFFVCLLDESAAAAAAGKAVSAQFGLVGGLIGGAVSAAKGSSRDKKMAELRAAQEAFTLEERLAVHPLSRSWPRAEVEALSSSTFGGISLTVSGKKLPLAIGPAQFEELAGWCAQSNITVTRPKKMSRTTKLIMLGTPVALVLVYLIAAVPMALKRQSNLTEAREKYEQVKALGEVVSGQLAATTVDLGSACSSALKAEPGDMVGYVALGDGLAKELEGGAEFPRLATTMRYGSRWEVSSSDLPSWLPRGGFSDAWVTMLTEFPGDWGRRAADIYPIPWQLRPARLLAVGKVLSASPTQSQTPLSGRAELAVRVVDIANGTAVCEGGVVLAFPPQQAKGGVYRSDREFTQEGIGRGMLLALCEPLKLCDSLAMYVQRAPVAEAATPAPSPREEKVAEAPVSPPAVKAGKAAKVKKAVKVTKTRRRR